MEALEQKEQKKVNPNSWVFQFRYYDPTYSPPPSPFMNPHNICWFNSLLQMLFSCTSLNKLLLEKKETLKNNPLATKYIEYLELSLPICKGTNNNANPALLANYSSQILGVFLQKLDQKKLKCPLGIGQECADEGLTLFLEALECPAAEGLFEIRQKSEIQCLHCDQVSSFRDVNYRDKSHRLQMFTSKIIQNETDFTNWIKAHDSEVDTWHCEKCNKDNPAKVAKSVTVSGLTKNILVNLKQTIMLTRLREIIIVVFYKYSIVPEVKYYPQNMTFNGENGKKFVYRLISTIERAGSFNHQTYQSSGHYWARVLRPGEGTINSDAGLTFWNANDMSISATTPVPTQYTTFAVYHIVKSE